MKAPLFLSLGFVLLVVGCAHNTVMLDTTPRAPHHSVAVFKDDSLPTQHYTVIAEMSWHGPRQDELISQKHFMKEAAKLGADAILFQIADVNKASSSSAVGANGVSVAESHSNNEWFFKAKAIVYQP